MEPIYDRGGLVVAWLMGSSMRRWEETITPSVYQFRRTGNSLDSIAGFW